MSTQLTGFLLEQFLTRIQEAVNSVSTEITYQYNVTKEIDVYEKTEYPPFTISISPRKIIGKTRVPSRHEAFDAVYTLLDELQSTVQELKGTNDKSD